MIYTFNFGSVLARLPELLWGAWLTVQLSFTAMAFGLAAGILLALAERSKIVPLRWSALSFGEIMRNTPFLIQIFLVFFGLPSLGLRLTPNEAAVFALSLNTAAYCSEIVRGGLGNVPRGEIEAARALGLHQWKVMRGIVFPQALAAVYPSLTSQFMMVLMTSSVVSVVSAEELTAVADNLSSVTFLSIEVYLIATAIYLGLSFILIYLLKAIGWYAFPSARRKAQLS
jgi:polar amino acid transport system permease protein